MRVLIIDDDRDMCAALRRGLEAENYAVDVACDGEEGSYVARTNEYDLLIVDNAMPRKDGRAVCAEVRAAGRHTPLLILSARVGTREKAALLDLGADDYLVKPFEFSELLARMRALLRRPPGIVDETLVVGPLSLNTRTQAVKRKDKDITLSRKEYMLLRYLMLNQGTVLSRTMIMEHVWDVRLDPFSNTVEAHMASLRKKIEDPREKRLIHTIPGRGYKIEC